MGGLDPLELLDALEVGVAVDCHGVDELVPGKLPGALGALLSVFLGLLDSHDLAVLKGDKGADLATVGGGLIKLLVELEKYILLNLSNAYFVGSMHRCKWQQACADFTFNCNCQIFDLKQIDF